MGTMSGPEVSVQFFSVIYLAKKSHSLIPDSNGWWQVNPTCGWQLLSTVEWVIKVSATDVKTQRISLHVMDLC